MLFVLIRRCNSICCWLGIWGKKYIYLCQYLIPSSPEIPLLDIYNPLCIAKIGTKGIIRVLRYCSLRFISKFYILLLIYHNNLCRKLVFSYIEGRLRKEKAEYSDMWAFKGSFSVLCGPLCGLLRSYAVLCGLLRSLRP
jgi:hypothetical protein